MTRTMCRYLFANELSGSLPASLGSLGNLAQMYGWSQERGFLFIGADSASGICSPTSSRVTSRHRWAAQQTCSSCAPPFSLFLFMYHELTARVGRDLSFNHLTGSVPSSLGNLTGLQNLCVSRHEVAVQRL
jgi:hypothetical protein